jgi:hypothetical protein
MDFGRSGGTFTGNFLDFDVNTVSKFAINATGSVMIGTSTLFGTSTMLMVCAATNCTLPASTSTVAVFASVDGTANTRSIVARGTITQGASDVGEYVYIEGLANDYDAGDLLAVSQTTSTRFAKTTVAYDSNLAGVVSKTAGFIGGGEIADRPDAVIIALSGRVPVKIIGENGSIKLGDSITASSITGYGMKSTLPGQIVGIALEAFDAVSSNATGTVMVFVKPSYSFPGAADYRNLQGGDSGAEAMNIFAFDEKLTVKIATLIAGKITVEDLTLGSADRPAGITIFDVKTKKPYCVVMEDGATKNYSGKCSDLNLGNLGQPYFDSDMGGFVVVKFGTKSVNVTFAQEYFKEPEVSANISFDTEGNSGSAFDGSLRFVISEKSTKGFTVTFNEAAPKDIKINWIALAVKNTSVASPEPVNNIPAATTDSGSATDTSQGEVAGVATGTPEAFPVDTPTTPPLTPVIEPPPADTQPAPAL